MVKSDNRLRTKPMRIAAIQFSQRPEDTMKIPAILEGGKFNVEQLLHIVGDGVYGLYEKSKYYDALKAYVAESSKRGIDIILYSNAHMISVDTFNNHQDWAQRDSDGKHVMAYDTYVFACVNSPWRDSFFENTRDALEHDIKGIFIDGPVVVGNGCNCDICKKLFAEQFGHSLDSANPTEIREFKTWSVAKFMKDTREVITKSGRDVVLYANSVGLSANTTGCDLDGIFPYVDLIGSEGGFIFYGNPNYTSIWRGAECTKYLESKSYGKPYVVFDAGNHQPWARHMHTEAETTLLYSDVIANGGNVWYGIHGLIDNFNTTAGKTAFNINRFLAENESYFENTKRYADVALVWSRDTINCYAGQIAESDFVQKEIDVDVSDIGSFQSEFFGISDMLFRNHTQFAIIDETNILNGDLSKYKTIILPNTICLDDKAIETIKQYVENGGNLIATLASGMCDHTGKNRPSSPFNKLFGIKNMKEIVSYKAGCGYMTFEGEKPFAENASDKIIAGFSDKVIKCSFDDKVEILASSYGPMEGRYAEFVEEKYPSVIVTSYGKGKTAYIAGGIGQTYADYGILDMKYIIESLVSRFTKSDIIVKNAYPTVEVEMRTQDDKERKLIHLVNMTGFMQRPIESFIECKNIEISLKVPKSVKSVKALYHKCTIPFTEENGVVKFLVNLYDYELITVEM
ncbi:MAG: beta-galactosidase trimerization domain-containing protein [Oscillospiraceae bacterium]|nr:beta-galactosidase trimerization domain-containing protein [Oscillospiraceae bacterium]